jgi:predicted XRE-type DNA-binding protein
MNGENLQRAIYDKLTGDATLMALIDGVYADVQQPLDAGSDVPFPYVTIGSDNLSSWDSKTFFGTEALCQIDVWSRANNFLEAKTVGSAIVNALHQQPLIIADASHVLTVQQSSVYSKDPDGHTKRGMLMFRVVFTRQ